MWRNGPDFYNYLQLIIIILVAFFGRGYLLGLITIFIFLTMNLLILNRLKFLASPVLLFFGKISYALYLLHQNIGHSIQLMLINNGINSVFLLIAIPFLFTIGIASLITFYFERDVIKKLNSLYKIKHV